MIAGQGDFWDRVAPAYALQAPLELPALRTALRLAHVERGERVLDAGCGTGLWMQLCRADGAPGRLVGVDRSRAMLALAKAALDPAAGAAPAELVRADLSRLPFEDGAFDVACAAYVLHLLRPAELEQALAELRRVLRDGGCIVTVTPYASGGIGPAWNALADRLASTRWRSMGGLRPLDTRPALLAAGFRLDAAATVHRGYPSLCVRAAPC